MKARARHLSILLSLGLLAHVTPSHADNASSATPSSTADGSASTTENASSAEPAFLKSMTSSLVVSAASRYMFQGIDYSDGRSVLQSNLVVNQGAFSAVLWANYQPDLGDVNEVDASLKYTHSFGKLTVSPGYTYLRYPNRDWLPTHELTADLAFSSTLNPTLSIHQDVDAGDGTYATLGVSQTVANTLSLASNVFYQHHYYEMTGVPAVEFKASASFPYGGMNLTPAVSYFATKSNRDFSAEARIPSGWLVAVDLTRKP